METCIAIINCLKEYIKVSQIQDYFKICTKYILYVEINIVGYHNKRDLVAIWRRCAT